MRPNLFEIAGFGVSSYYAIGILAVVIGFFILAREADRIGVDRRIAVNAATIATIFGYIGARIQHIIFDGFFDIYLQKPIAMLYFWKGGLAFYGCVVFGGLTVVGYLQYKKQPIAAYLDLFAYPLALGIALGRVGCYLNGCCFGKISSASYAQTFITDGLSAKKQYIDNILNNLNIAPYPVIPTQLIEFGVNIVIFSFMYFYVRTHYKKDGVPFGIWLVLYSFTRFLIEIFRDDDRGLFFSGLISTSQLIALGCAAFGFALIYLPAEKRERKPA